MCFRLTPRDSSVAGLTVAQVALRRQATIHKATFVSSDVPRDSRLPSNTRLKLSAPVVYSRICVCESSNLAPQLKRHPLDAT
jgi:hypothetical protein